MGKNQAVEKAEYFAESIGRMAYQALLEELGGDGGVTYYCVGHSVIQYTLDGYAFSTLVNHRGRQAAVELIATFLPSEVVESLYGAMQQTELTIMSITLEPIAAISAVIPQELRLLNIALVDVGAGTSDIAITNNGSVCAYTMATMAGTSAQKVLANSIFPSSPCCAANTVRPRRCAAGMARQERRFARNHDSTPLCDSAQDVLLHPRVERSETRKALRRHSLSLRAFRRFPKVLMKAAPLSC